MAKDGKHVTVEGPDKSLIHKFSKGGALKKSGHHGIIGDGKGKGMKAHKGIHGAEKGHFMASPSNVGKLGHK
jgi:hypothetical protein